MLFFVVDKNSLETKKFIFNQFKAAQKLLKVCYSALLKVLSRIVRIYGNFKVHSIFLFTYCKHQGQTISAPTEPKSS